MTSDDVPPKTCPTTTEVSHDSGQLGETNARALGLSADGPSLGRRIGPYRIERLLARGGMGVVYVAVREDDYEQRVALKLIHPERLSVRGLDRFYKERQILARLQHPNVARLLDGGTTDEVLPYLVMEYVEGEPINRYCERHQLSIRRRLALFCTVCEAVHFAHRNLVVHRDLKPSNVLVTPAGVVKLLDFGIAKLLDTDPFADSRTGSSQEPMTPTYASPEQLGGLTVSTASDVYSLGVLLCKLLTGRLPYSVSEHGTARFVEAVCQAEPKPPSSLTRSETERRRLAGDVDSIVLKALRKEPEQRYASALQLAEDVRRHLESRPVKAHPGNWTYRAAKLARRRKLGLAMVLTVLGFSVATTVAWRQAVRQKVRAEESLLRAEQVSTFLKELFRTADPNVARGEAPTVREAIDRSRARLLGGELDDAPEVRAELLGALGMVYNDLGFFDDARQLKEEGLRIRRAADPSDRPVLAADLNNLGRLYYDVGEYAAAEVRFSEAVAMWRRLGVPAEVATSLRNLAAAAMHQGRYEEALGHHREILEIQHELLDAEHPEVASSLYSLGTLHRLRDEPEQAEPLLRQALAIYSQAYGPRHTRVAAVKSSLGRVLHALGRHPEARELYEQALDVRRQLLGEDHVRVAVTRRLLAELLLDEGETAVAHHLLEVTLDTLRRSGSDASSEGDRTRTYDDWQIAEAESVWGSYLTAMGRYPEAERYLLASYRLLLEVKGERHISTREAARRVAALYEAWGRKEAAAAYHAAAEEGTALEG